MFKQNKYNFANFLQKFNSNTQAPLVFVFFCWKFSYFLIHFFDCMQSVIIFRKNNFGNILSKYIFVNV